MEKSKEYPFKLSTGEFRLLDGSNIKYRISTQGTMNEPVSLTFTAFKKDGTPENSLRTDSTLYFDINGNITSRAPMNPYTSALKLKELYGKGLAECIAPDSDEYPLIRGFFEAGEGGVTRETSITAGKVTKILRDESM